MVLMAESRKPTTTSQNSPEGLLTKAGGYDDYGLSIRALVRGLWRDELTLYDFMTTMGYAITRNFTRAWIEAAQTCGILPPERTQEEDAELQRLITTEIQYVFQFADAIQKNSRARRGKLSPLLERAQMWQDRYRHVYAVAQSMACADAKYRWEMNPRKEHCPDCVTLNGRVYRASTWRRYRIAPQMRELACHGYRCGCSFVPTDEPATPGRPPNIAGL